jgi:hypothetical protein
MYDDTTHLHQACTTYFTQHHACTHTPTRHQACTTHMHATTSLRHQSNTASNMRKASGATRRKRHPVYTPCMTKKKSRSAAPSTQTKTKPSIDFRTPTLGHSRGISHLMLAREAVGRKSCCCGACLLMCMVCGVSLCILSRSMQA